MLMQAPQLIAVLTATAGLVGYTVSGKMVRDEVKVVRQ